MLGHSGLEATCMEDLRNHPQSHHSSRLKLLKQKSHSVPRQESLQGWNCSSLGSQMCHCTHLLHRYACSWLHTRQSKLPETGIDVYGKNEHTFIVKILEHAGKIMNKNGAHNFKTQRLNAVNNLVHILVAICLYVWECI